MRACLPYLAFHGAACQIHLAQGLAQSWALVCWLTSAYRPYREHWLLQADLIGHEQEGKRDEKMRASLHAAWLEQQDSARMEALLHGVKNGFRRKRGALDDEASAGPFL